LWFKRIYAIICHKNLDSMAPCPNSLLYKTTARDNVSYTFRLLISWTALCVKTPTFIVPCWNNKYYWHLVKAVTEIRVFGYKQQVRPRMRKVE
jgi:hypothetical protein